MKYRTILKLLQENHNIVILLSNHISLLHIVSLSFCNLLVIVLFLYTVVPRKIQSNTALHELAKNQSIKVFRWSTTAGRTAPPKGSNNIIIADGECAPYYMLNGSFIIMFTLSTHVYIYLLHTYVYMYKVIIVYSHWREYGARCYSLTPDDTTAYNAV